jgi:tyrosyl-tRNA synthetase
VVHPLLVGTDGHEKMSKSLGNAIGITEAPEQMYGKVMSISDALMETYIERLGAGEWGDLAPARAALAAGGGEPLALKQALASRLVARFHGAEAAAAAEAHFRRVVQNKEAPADLDERSLPLSGAEALPILDVLQQLGLIGSKSEGRRLLAEGAIQLDGARIDDPAARLGPGAYLLRAGRRRFARVRIA